MEEDFLAIGLIRESRQTSDEDEDKQVSEGVESSEDDEGLDEALKLKRRQKKSAALRRALKRARHKEYLQNKGTEKLRSRKYSKTSRGKKRAKQRASFWRKHSGQAGKPQFRLAGLERVANMVEEVGNIVGTIGERKDTEIVRGFANVALIADIMSRGFQAIGKDVDEEELVKLGEAFADMAEDAASIAEGLDAGDLEIDEEVEAAFKADMDDLLNGLELYADLTEDDEEEDGEPVEGDEDTDDDEGN